MIAFKIDDRPNEAADVKYLSAEMLLNPLGCVVKNPFSPFMATKSDGSIDADDIVSDEAISANQATMIIIKISQMTTDCNCVLQQDHDAEKDDEDHEEDQA